MYWPLAKTADRSMPLKGIRRRCIFCRAIWAVKGQPDIAAKRQHDWNVGDALSWPQAEMENLW